MGGHRGQGGQGRGGRVGIHLVCPAGGTAHDEVVDEHNETRPPKALGNAILGTENTAMAPVANSWRAETMSQRAPSGT
jgi:hypothetical protein